MSEKRPPGGFRRPLAAEEEGNLKMLLAPEAFVMLTDGIDMHGAKPHGWYDRE